MGALERKPSSQRSAGTLGRKKKRGKKRAGERPRCTPPPSPLPLPVFPKICCINRCAPSTHLARPRPARGTPPLYLNRVCAVRCRSPRFPRLAVRRLGAVPAKGCHEYFIGAGIDKVRSAAPRHSTPRAAFEHFDVVPAASKTRGARAGTTSNEVVLFVPSNFYANVCVSFSRLRPPVVADRTLRQVLRLFL